MSYRTRSALATLAAVTVAVLVVSLSAKGAGASPQDGGQAWLDVVPRVETSHHKLYSPSTSDEHTQIWFQVWHRFYKNGQWEDWKPPVWFDIGPKEQGDCPLDYEFWEYLEDGQLVQYYVYSNNYGDGRPVYNCVNDDRIDPDIGTPGQYSPELGPHESWSLYFDYNIAP